MNKGLLILLAGVFLFFTGITTLHVVCMAFPGDPYCASNTVAQNQGNLQNYNIGNLMIVNGSVPDCGTCCYGTCEIEEGCPDGQEMIDGVCDYPESPVCANGAYNYPECTSCPHPYEMIDGLCQENVIEGGVCGDGVLNAGEDCEPSIFSTYSYNKRQCKTPTLIGDVTCNSDCTFNSDNCRSCPAGQQITNAGSWHKKRGCEAIPTDPEDSDDGNNTAVEPVPPVGAEQGDTTGAYMCGRNYVTSCPGLRSYQYGVTKYWFQKEPCMLHSHTSKVLKYKKPEDGFGTKSGRVTCQQVCSSGVPSDMKPDWATLTWFGDKCTVKVAVHKGDADIGAR